MCDEVNFINKFKFFSEIEPVFVSEIKLFYKTVNSLLFVTTYELVYHYDTFFKLLKVFPPFCENQIIIKLSCSVSYFMVLTDNGRVYSWGDNSYGQTGIGRKRSYIEETTLINGLIDHFIINICCGKTHSLVLTNTGDVFAYGQCEIEKLDSHGHIIPKKVSVEKIIAISCGDSHSTVLSENDVVYGWGSNSMSQLGIEGHTIEKPTQLNLQKFKQVICGPYFTLMLSSVGDVYYCGTETFSTYSPPIKLNPPNTKFIKIAVSNHSWFCALLSDDYICYLHGSSKLRHESFKMRKNNDQKSIHELFEYYTDSTYKSINALKTKNYKKSFTEYSLLGCGGFSAVYKSRYNLGGPKLYAIKKICFEPDMRESVLKELKMLSHFKSKFVVFLYEYWIERNYYIASENTVKEMNHLFLPEKTQLLHIKMELCSLTLRDAINPIIKECVSTTDKTLSLIGYYITSELFYEILECVQHLHSQNPAIIHRDLKPENILITNFNNNRFVKLSDFGLSTFHEFDDQTHTKYIGTKYYRAQEVSYGDTHYSTKVDCFSLGIITQELFSFNISNSNQKFSTTLRPKMNYLLKLVELLLSPVPDKRPNCEQVLSEDKIWLLSDKEIRADKAIQRLLSKTSKPKSIEENFIEFFIQKKYELKHINRNESSNTAIFSKVLSLFRGN